MNYLNNVKVINILFINNIKYIEDISSFLANSILEVGSNLFSCDTESKAKRLLKSLDKHFDKLFDLENKKSLDLTGIKSNSLELVKKCTGSIDRDYRDYLIKAIKKIEYVTNYYRFLIEEFNKYKEYVDCKEETVKKHNVRFVLDDKDNIYANLYYNQGILVFDESSFRNEVWLFNDALNKSERFDMKIPSKYGDKLSTLERKRRIYIKTMFKLYSGMKIVEKSKDSNTPINLYYSFAIILLANLYKEMFIYHRKNKEFNRLWLETIKSYGCSKGIDIYETIYFDYINNHNEVEDRDLKQVKNKISNRVFIDIEQDIPSVQDIYKILNMLIIKNIERNYGFYIVDLVNRVEGSMKYMIPSEMVDFYREFKRVLIDHDCSNDELVKLQKAVVFMLNKRVPKNDNYICRNYLEEDKIF